MFNWLAGEGASLKHHIPGSTNYITDLKDRLSSGSDNKPRSESDEGDNSSSAKRPFPLNPTFVSSPILSEDLRNEIYKRVVKQKKSVRAVSVELQVDMRRIGAAVRLVELEKRMEKEVRYFCFCSSLVTSVLRLSRIWSRVLRPFSREPWVMSKLPISLEDPGNSQLGGGY